MVRNPRLLPGIDQTYDADTSHSLNDPNIFPFDVNVLGTSRTTVLGGNYQDRNYRAEARAQSPPRTRLQPREILHPPDRDRQWRFEQHLRRPQPLPAGHDHAESQSRQALLPGPARTTTPSLDERDDWRATLSYEFDARAQTRRAQPLGKWLGRHRFAGLYTGRGPKRSTGQNYHRRILDDPVMPGITLRPKTFQNWATNVPAIPQFRHYLESPTDTRVRPAP